MKSTPGGVLSRLLAMALVGAPGVGAAETCEDWVARVVSVQGVVEARMAGEAGWSPARPEQVYCPGDTVRVQKRSRAALVLRNEAVLRLDEETTITFDRGKEQEATLLDLLRGAVHFFSRMTRALTVVTPFVNGAVEGTEFFAQVEGDRTLLSVFEGRVVAANKEGSLVLGRGQSAEARAGQAPSLRTVVRPRDAVQWALYYPPVLDERTLAGGATAEAGWQEAVRRSAKAYRAGDLTQAFAALEGVPEEQAGPLFFAYRAELSLSVGRVDQAKSDLEKALQRDARYSPALAVRAVIAVAQNEKREALDLATKAVEMDPESSTARVALSYAQQAQFDLEGALESLRKAVKLDPGNALAWARLAELWLSVGNIDRAREAAGKAVALNPNLSRTQTVLGFANLAAIKVREAEQAFRTAIERDQADPLPRLGLGLAIIRQGDVEGGRTQIEIAASLDPNNSLIRSYLGKAYFEEKRDRSAGRELAVAKELDPLDPTPWFYDAIRKQTINRPVEALHDLQESIELNDNRAVYRSRLQMDEDLAARSASLARIYRDLGFERLALVEGWKSVNTDPTNYSAHRFLADAYSALPRHEIARVSEVLQSQLLQPINVTPVQPSLAEANLLILEGAGPADLAFNEFSPMFLRNRLALQAAGTVGENDTVGDELVQSGVYGRFSYSLGQLYYDTDGFRDNNDLKKEIYNVFAQASLSHKTNVQAEFRYKDTENGDLELRFLPNDFRPGLRESEESKSIRFGVHHTFSTRSDIIGSFIFEKADTHISLKDTTPFLHVELDDDTDGHTYTFEVQHLFRSHRLSIVSGAGYLKTNNDLSTTAKLTFPGPIPPPEPVQESSHNDIQHTNLYTYAQIAYPKPIIWTLGGSGDFFKDDEEGGFRDRNQFNPKFGLTWNPFPGTTLRASLFRVLRRTLTLTNQTLEPTQVAGFNQFFDDVSGTEAWRYGVAADQKFSANLYGGAEYSRRDLDVPERVVSPPRTVHTDWEEKLAHAYVYWTPHPWLAFRGEYLYERYDREKEFNNGVEFVRTHRFPIGADFFHPSGWSIGIQATYFDQKGKFNRLGELSLPAEPGSDEFWIVDASVSYRLPRRFGIMTIGAKNLFKESFNYQDTDLVNPIINPERMIFFKAILFL